MTTPPAQVVAALLSLMVVAFGAMLEWIDARERDERTRRVERLEQLGRRRPNTWLLDEVDDGATDRRQ